MQFEATYRRLLVRCGVQPSVRGNVHAQDQTVSLSSLDSSATPVDGQEVAQCPFEDNMNPVGDHCYTTPGLGKLTENALVYIAGWVVRKVMLKLDCDVCRHSIVSATVPTSLECNYQLLHLKNNGGLVVPAEGVIKLVIVAERYLRQLTDVNFASHQIKTVRLLTMVKAHVGAVDIFGLGHHIVETQFGVDNHHYNLISLLVSVFHKLRQHHVAKLHTQQLQRGNIRKKVCKTVLFMGH